MFNIVFKPSVDKDLRRVPGNVVERVLERIEGLQTAPFSPQSVKLAGAERLYRIRIGDYRIVYEVETKEKRITIHYVRHRREVYRDI